MSIQVETKDCTSISDAELAEMADLCADREPRYDIGFLSKQQEEWVLVTRAREGNKLRGYSFSTLERIGGTPSLLIGLATIDRTSRADTVLRAMMGDKYRRALLAYPMRTSWWAPAYSDRMDSESSPGSPMSFPAPEPGQRAKIAPGDADWPSVSGQMVALMIGRSWLAATETKPVASISPVRNRRPPSR